MNTPVDGYTVYCDESRHVHSRQNPYMAIGGLWVPTSQKSDLIKRLRELLSKERLHAEVKWSKTSERKFDSYKALVDFFFDSEMSFRAVVVDQSKPSHAPVNASHADLGFYSYYYKMLIQWLDQPVTYNLLLDFKKNERDDHYRLLEQYLSQQVPPQTHVSGVHVINSIDTPLAQLADLLTGAVAAAWCGFPRDTAKAKLANYLAAKAGKDSLRQVSSGAAFEKININQLAHK